MKVLGLLLAAVSALAFYLATAHSQWWPAARTHARWTRGAAWVLAAAATIVAGIAIGPWAGLFAALTAFMLAAVALPWLDVARRLRRERRHVG